MDFDAVFPLIVGYQHLGSVTRLYVESPTPVASFTRSRGVQTALFRLLAGDNAQAVRAWLARNRAWQCLRVPPPYTPQMGGRAVLVASEWHCGGASALFRFARDRVIADHAHRQRLQQEVRVLVGSVIENPVRAGELEDLQAVEDVVNVAPLGVELCGIGEVVTASFGSA